MGLEQDLVGPCLAAALHYAAVTASALKNHRAIDAKAKIVAEINHVGRLRAFLQCLESVLESTLCPWVLMDEGGQSLGLLQRSSHRCVPMSAVSAYGKCREALVCFSPEDLIAACLENLSVQVLLLLCSMVWTALLSYLSK